MGKLVAVDGPDRVGKTTLLQHMTFELRERNFSVRNFRFPPDERSREVDHLYDVFTKGADPMKQQLALVGIFNAYGPKLLKALRGHDIVLVDRYMLSPLIACKALGLDLKMIDEALRKAIIPPDVTVIFTGEPFVQPHLPPEEAAFEEKVHELFEKDIPEYRHPVIRVSNEAMHAGKQQMFIQHLVDQVLGHLGKPLKQEPPAESPSNR